MSGKIMGKVWDLDLPHNQLLVLLALADHADHEGNNVFPSLGLVAWKTGYSEQQVRRVMRALVKAEILVEQSRNPGKPTRYRIDIAAGKPKLARVITPDKKSPLTKSHPLHSDGVTPDMLSAKNDDEPSIEPSSIGAPKAPRKSDPQFDIISEVWGTRAGGWVSNLQGMLCKSKNVKGDWLKSQLDTPATVDEIKAFGTWAKRLEANKGKMPTVPATIERQFYQFRSEQAKKMIYDREGYIPVEERTSVLDGVKLA